MATPILNGVILQASRRVQEYRTSAAATDDTGRRWTSANWTDYANNALRDLLLDKLQKLGPAAFAAAFPEYVKNSGTIVLVSGEVAMPDGALAVLELKDAANAFTFFPVPQSQVYTVQSGRDKMIVPSSTYPVFWTESGVIKTLGVTAGNVVARYIYAPSDLAVITTADGNGKKNSANGSWTAATNRLTIAMAGNFVSGQDENRLVMFYDNNAGKVYYGRIASIGGTGYCTLTGDGLPTSNIAAGDVTIALMEQLSDPDILLNRMWHGELIERMVKYALSDTLTAKPQ